MVGIHTDDLTLGFHRERDAFSVVDQKRRIDSIDPLECFDDVDPGKDSFPRTLCVVGLAIEICITDLLETAIDLLLEQSPFHGGEVGGQRFFQGFILRFHEEFGLEPNGFEVISFLQKNSFSSLQFFNPLDRKSVV